MNFLLAKLGIITILPLLTSARSWYDLGLYGIYPTEDYVSFGMKPPLVSIAKWDDSCNCDYTLLTPRGSWVRDYGPMILGPRGGLVWMETKFGVAMDLKVQQYNGENFLTFWAGVNDGTHGRGVYYMASQKPPALQVEANKTQLNTSYDVVHVLSAGNGLEGDLHEFKITPEGTALITIYEIVSADLSAFGIKSGWIYDGLFQEIDIATGEVLFQWRSSEHYKVEETFEPIGWTGRTKGTAFDFFHINSIAKDPMGNYYVSSRYMHSVTCISPDGNLNWVLGGRRNEFKDLSYGAATNISWNHHVDWHDNDTLTIFDNGATDEIQTAQYSRALLISIDSVSKTAKVLQQFVTPGKYLSQSQGSVQILPDNGNIFVGWGHTAAYSEFTADGELLCDTHFGPSLFFGWGKVKSYRGFKAPWIGRPRTPPDVKMPDKQSIFVSWNGATEVASWVLQGASPEHPQFMNIGQIPKDTFEASFELGAEVDDYDFLRIAAMDLDDDVLGYTSVVDRRSRKMVSDSFVPLDLDTDVEHEESFLLQGSIFITSFFFGVWFIWRFRRTLVERASNYYRIYCVNKNASIGFQPVPTVEIG
ncbi:hypothetical protein BP5796_00693 [Coleophoma crateriformis]|uniref:ASST-domain-containing protein n=1 Tax=Coleophoma crateriformis TaxID=565419 RepID=A0A3D8T8Q2_9HELO|nr:hypothetical protein BP5796_00693 [Coleophoma crateriformis]